MLIRYSADHKQYLIRDLGDGTGTFIKISHPFKVINGFIVSFGDTHMTISVDKDKKIATIKFLEGILANEKKYSLSSEYSHILIFPFSLEETKNPVL